VNCFIIFNIKITKGGQMALITNAAYSTNNYYYNSSEKLTGQTSSAPDSKSETTAQPSVSAGDTVTLSSEVATARTREAMGLNPTGSLKLGDFESAAKAQEQLVESKLASLMEELGVDENQKISLSLDAESNITIEESFSGKSDLEGALNDDKEFALAFKRLSANNEILDYTKELQTSSTNLSDFMDSGSDWNDLLSLASKYSEIKSAGNSLDSLLGVSKTQTPYTFTYNSET